MGDVVQNSINYIKENYPEMKTTIYKMYIEFSGRFVIQAYYDDIVLDIAPKLLIQVPLNYPERLPLVFDQNGKYQIKDHLLENGSLCVGTEFDLKIQLCRSESIEDYIDNFLIPYFISYQGLKDKNEYIYGDRDHGVDGIFQSIGEYFNIDEGKKDQIKELLTWAIKIKPFYKLFPDVKYRNLQVIKYSDKIGDIRKIGILNLKKIIKSIERGEIVKQYYEYRKFL